MESTEATQPIEEDKEATQPKITTTIEFPTDKHFNGLLRFYQHLFSSINTRPLKILEIGVLYGGTTMWLLNYFPNSTVVAMDNVLPTGLTSIEPQLDRLILVRGDQNDPAFNLPFEEFDLIIDDGCHYLKETKNTFEICWPKVVPGGTYLIEDFYVGFGEYSDNPLYRGMDKLVSDIMLNKNALGISNFDIMYREPQCSVAWFQKKKALEYVTNPLLIRINKLEQKIIALEEERMALLKLSS